MADLIKIAEEAFATGKSFPEFKAGDTITVAYKIVEDQDIVEDDVAQHHNEGVERERAGVGGTDIKGAENEGDEGKRDARHAPRQVNI